MCFRVRSKYVLWHFTCSIDPRLIKFHVFLRSQEVRAWYVPCWVDLKPTDFRVFARSQEVRAWYFLCSIDLRLIEFRVFVCSQFVRDWHFPCWVDLRLTEFLVLAYLQLVRTWNFPFGWSQAYRVLVVFSLQEVGEKWPDTYIHSCPLLSVITCLYNLWTEHVADSMAHLLSLELQLHLNAIALELKTWYFRAVR